MSYRVAFERRAEKEFLRLPLEIRERIARKILDLKEGRFEGDKPLQGKHKGKYRKRAGDYRIVYWRKKELLLITVIRIAHRKEVYH